MIIKAIEEIEEEVFAEAEFLSGECPSCRKIFPSDEELLGHICEEKVTEY